MAFPSCRSTRAVLLMGAFATACVLRNPASAEAYSSHANRHASLWNHQSHQWIVLQCIHAGGEGRSSNVNKRFDRFSSRFQSTRLCDRGGGGGGGDAADGCSKKQLVRELLAEMIGTATIVQIGTGAVMSAIFGNALVGLFQIASAWIIAVTLAVATTGCISGAHLNPAISIAFALLRPSKTFGWTKVIPFSLAQLSGAVLASAVNLMLYASKIREFEAANKIVRGTASSVASAKAFGEYFESPVSALTAFAAEALGTAILAFVIFSLTHPKSDAAKNNVYIPPLIGAAVGGLIAVFAPLTQAGFNPARDFGPRLIAFLAGWKAIAFQGWWVYVVAPIVGAPIGAWVADKVLYADDR